MRPDDDGGFDVEPFFWLPEADILDRERRDRLPYRDWAAAGLVQLTPGNVVDYAYIKQRILDLADERGGFELAYDPWGATGLVTELSGEGLTCIATRQGFATLSAPTKELERLVLSAKLRHGGHAVLRSHASSALVETDAAGNLKPSKAKSTARIDGLVALVMALNAAMLAGSRGSGRSVYEDRGVEVI